MSNVFKRAKQLRKSNPSKSWQQLVQMASKKGTAKKKAAPKKKARRKVGAYKVIERGESRRTPAKKVVRNVRSKTGLFKGVVTVGSIKAHYEAKLQAALWAHEKAKTVKATKAAAKRIREYRAMLKKL